MILYLVLVFSAVALLFILGQGSYFFVKSYNSLVELRNDIVKAWANIDVMLKQRSDEIPNLVSTVKGYMEHERTVLIEVTKARTAMDAAKTPGEKDAANKLLFNSLQRLYAVAESYPTLKADESFLKLQMRITGVENQIADRRELYNDAVTIYNTRIEALPDMLIAKHMGFARMPLFRASKNDRENIRLIFERG